MSIKIITTEDGSHSLFDEALNETYHSTRGALGESLHVFIKEGLGFFLHKEAKETVRILEIGLGTGLNALLSLRYANQYHQRLTLSSLEPFPVEKVIYEKLNYHTSVEEKELFQKIHTSGWEEQIRFSDYFELTKSKNALEEFEDANPYDIIFFDAFAPSKQPEVWSPENLKKCFDLLRSGGLLTTYCAQGQFKRNLAAAGFVVETLQGAMGKKEMVRGIKP